MLLSAVAMQFVIEADDQKAGTEPTMFNTASDVFGKICVPGVTDTPALTNQYNEVFPTYHSDNDDDPEATPQRNSRVGLRR